jgi:hypothetical protein
MEIDPPLASYPFIGVKTTESQNLNFQNIIKGIEFEFRIFKITFS